jgi:hypothetical protein
VPQLTVLELVKRKQQRDSETSPLVVGAAQLVEGQLNSPAR